MNLLPSSVSDLLQSCDRRILPAEDFQLGYCQSPLRTSPNRYPILNNQETMVFRNSRGKQQKLPVNQDSQFPTGGLYKKSECINGGNSRSEKIETLRECQWQPPVESIDCSSYIAVSGSTSKVLPIISSDGIPMSLMHTDAGINPSKWTHSNMKEDIILANAFLPQFMVDGSQVMPGFLPEKGKFLEAVMKAGPLLQTLLLAGPLPSWQQPPPPLDSFEIPLVPLSPNPSMINSLFIPPKLTEY